MNFNQAPAPFLKPLTSVGAIMRQVLYALMPATIAYVWFFGWGIVIQMLIAVVFALAAEAMMLSLRGKPLRPFLGDCSALITAVLLAWALPPTAPWWLAAVGVIFAIVFAKHLYGGLGYNVFNPAMAGYVVLLISFPQQMTQWIAPDFLIGESVRLSFMETLQAIFAGFPAGTDIDAVTAATPLDHLRTQRSQGAAIQEITTHPIYSMAASHGWDWIGVFLLLGGAWLLYRRVITWQIPAG